MMIKRLFNNNDIPQTIKNTWLLIIIVSVVNFISIYNIFESYVSDHNTVISLTEIRYGTLQLTIQQSSQQQNTKALISKIDSKLANIISNTSWFNTSNLRNNSIILMQQWHVLALNSNKNSLFAIQRSLSDFLSSATSLQLQYELLSNKKSKLLYYITLSYLLFLLIFLFIIYYFSTNNDSIMKNQKQPTKYANQNEKKIFEEELHSLSKMKNQIKLKTQALEKANNRIEFLYLTSQQLSVVKLTSPILQQALNDLAMHLKLQKACLELKNGHFISSELGCATADVNYNRVPIIINNKPYGFLNYVSTIKTDADDSLLESFTGLVARALYQQEYNLQENKILLMEERSIIARELHDSIAQSLSFLKIQSAILQRQLTNSDQQSVHKTINHIDVAVSDAYKHLRSLLSTFRLNAPESNFRDALQTVIDTLQPQTTAKITIQQFTCDFSTDASQHIHLLQIIREAVINAIKHAESTRIDISCIITSENNLWVNVVDNGVGIATSTDNDIEEHYGLSIMKQRAEQLGATLTFTHLDKGTEMKLIIPSNKAVNHKGIINA